MEKSEKKVGWLSRLNRRLKGTGDSEPEQAKLRLAIGLIVLVYICVPWGSGESLTEAVTSLAGLIVILFYSCAMLIFGAIIVNPAPSQIRRICGAALDMGSLSILMFHTGSEVVPLFLIYLWVILGNGFRFGLSNLYVSQVIAIIGFSVVVIWGEFWQEHRSFGISLLLMLCLLPLYAGFLIKKLHAAVSMAKQANEAKSRFLANMSHELRTPLNGVIGMGDLLRETKLNYEQQELVNTMHSSANTLLELIENVLDIAKIEAGKILIESKDFDLHGLVNSVIYMLAPMGNKKDLTVSCTFDPETPFALKGDKQHLRQILINLVNNAIKFTEQGSVILSVRLVGGTESTPRIRFEITDTGIGIADENIGKIFDDFTQADAGTSRAFGGTGLGTTISKELVELMNGEIGLVSELDKGSTFWFEIPFVASRNPETSISENHVLLLAGEDTANVIRPSLKYWQVNFDWVRTSTRALSQLIRANDDSQPYETIVVDQSCLSDINAVQFAQMVKSEGLLENTSMVLINSSDTMIDANKSNHYYISTIANPEEKRLLFNALHAAQSVNLNDSKIVTMAEHYARQAGASALNILVAEDNKVNQQVIEGILRNAGHNIRIASTGEKTLDILSDEMEKVDMLIMDMNMPEISGVEVVKSLRFMDTSGQLPIIMLTADATPEAREASLNAGANRFLTKPIDARGLLECIASLSKNIRRSQVAKAPAEKESRAFMECNFAQSEWYDNIVLQELDILGEDPDFLKTLLKNFEKEGASHILELKKAMYDDYLEYRENLHALKGSATELGANKLVAVCAEGEALKPYDMGSEKINQMCLKIEEVFNNTVAALNNAATVQEDIYPKKSTDQ
ncbi:MAG: ATP-binding protein [Gammaproteobacteria bacterium]|nr:ATP-binding protein [Gammaproteobacteria bacterium]MDH3447260.1 ATP-binding protein [Gammaproteobacteria bacterium]